MGTTGTSLTHADGWTIFYAKDNDTLKSIASRFGLDAAALLDFNVSTVAGVALKARLCSGTAIRIKCPAKGGDAVGGLGPAAVEV